MGKILIVLPPPQPGGMSIPAIHTSTSTGRPPVIIEQPSEAAFTPITLSIRNNHTHALSQLSNVHFLLLFIWKVPIFLCIFWVSIWYRKISREMPDRYAPS
ncbi:uncharacterized protein RBU57_014528 [Macrochelys suwanniensis]